jgi:PA domain
VYAVTPTPHAGAQTSDSADATSEAGGSSDWLIFPADIQPGKAAFAVLAVNCTDQALNLTVVPALWSPQGDSHDGRSFNSSTSSEAISSSASVDNATSSFVLALRHGGLPGIGGQVFDFIARPRGSDGAATLFLPAARAGLYTAKIVNRGNSPMSGGFRLAASVVPSRAPNPSNGCLLADGSVIMKLTPSDPATGNFIADSGVTLHSSDTGLADMNASFAEGIPNVLQMALGDDACAGNVSACDIAAAVAFAGGAINGTAVLAQSSPAAPNILPFFYVSGDPRKYLGNYTTGEGSTETSPPPAVLYATLGGNSAATDLEACSPLSNSDAMRGGICVAVRGGCPFTEKIANCQAAGAVIAVIINDDAMSPLSATPNWLLTGPNASNLSIPALEVSFSAGTQILGFLLDPRAVPSESPPPVVESAPWMSPYTRPVAVSLSVYACAPTTMCQACAPGLASPLDACSSAACPGMDARYSRNCSGHGVCTLVLPSGFGPAEGTCACDDGWAAADCGTSTTAPYFVTQPPALVAVAPGDTVRLLTRAADAMIGDVVYTLIVGPPGAVINPSSGLFLYDTSPLMQDNTGAINATFPVQVQATSARNGLSATASFSILVSDAQPDNATNTSTVAPGPTADAPSPAPVPAPTPANESQMPPPQKQRSVTSSSDGSSQTPSVASGGKLKSAGLDGAAIAGVVIAVVAATSLTGLGVFAFSRNRKSFVGPMDRMRQARMERHTQLVEF